MPEVGLEPDFYPCRRWEATSFCGSTAQYDAVRASPEGHVFPAGTVRNGTTTLDLFRHWRCECHRSVTQLIRKGRRHGI